METEKWGEDEQVAMDVDMSEEDQLLMISEVQQARGSIVATTSSSGLEQLYSGAVDFSVSLYCLVVRGHGLVVQERVGTRDITHMIR